MAKAMIGVEIYSRGSADNAMECKVIREWNVSEVHSIFELTNYHYMIPFFS